MKLNRFIFFIGFLFCIRVTHKCKFSVRKLHPMYGLVGVHDKKKEENFKTEFDDLFLLL